MSFESLASKKFCVCDMCEAPDDLAKRISELERGNGILADGLLDREQVENKIFNRIHRNEKKITDCSLRIHCLEKDMLKETLIKELNDKLECFGDALGDRKASLETLHDIYRRQSDKISELEAKLADFLQKP